MHKYGLLVYKYIAPNQNNFDVISLPWDAVQTWPTQLPIEVVDRLGQVQYQWPETVFFKIVEDSNWSQTQDDALTNAVADWNADPANVNRLIPGSLQLVYTPEEAVNIPAIFEAERQRLIDQL